ncbi:hypothetical protein F7Q99_30625 [Streptomyces kaniharaensis]|uniref:Uncharacterized protein n=1 Tax=Streptomyces kaniharaensis TaxID=212423 RepID=A0A6N7L3L8_9ACTN|nr:hypothetical protein [Streptomyces kaniharaensis]MQS16433.1 hypothetical protein [Streptomyces kaniharaensis]
MAEPDFDAIADALYTLAPQDFTAARNEHANTLKKTDPQLAKQIRALRRPPWQREPLTSSPTGTATWSGSSWTSAGIRQAGQSRQLGRPALAGSCGRGPAPEQRSAGGG